MVCEEIHSTSCGECGCVIQYGRGYIRTYVYIHTYVCMSVLYIRMYVHMYTVCTYVPTYVRIYSCSVCVCVCMNCGWMYSLCGFRIQMSVSSLEIISGMMNMCTHKSLYAVCACTYMHTMHHKLLAVSDLFCGRLLGTSVLCANRRLSIIFECMREISYIRMVVNFRKEDLLD